MCSSGSSYIIVFGDRRGSNWQLHAQRISNSGSILWDTLGVPITIDPALPISGDIISDGRGGAIIIWDDERNGNHDIYAQRIDSLGQIYWQNNGIFVCSAADSSAERIYLESVSDGKSGVILAWSPWDGPDENIFAQRVDSLGICQWDSSGLPVCIDPNFLGYTLRRFISNSYEEDQTGEIEHIESIITNGTGSLRRKTLIPVIAPEIIAKFGC